MAREINLVPDVKGEMIKALKLRNFILFLSIVVAISSVGVVFILSTILGAQQLAVDGKKATVESMSAKVKSYSDLTDFLTIKDQLGNIQNIANNKKLLSRTFGILSALIPTSPNTIKISELSVSLEETPTFSFDAQANDDREPSIDYNVLDSFKKSMPYMRYDYGRYVDENGNNIPAYCIIESGLDGAIFTDADRGIYAFWTINSGDCYGSESSSEEEDDESDSYDESESKSESKSESEVDYCFDSDFYHCEEYEGKKVVRIWRTPQYTEWYRDKHLTESGTISGVPHFESKCIRYYSTKDSSGTLKWTSENDSCLLVPAGIDGIKISDSSNGRDASDDLVLRFSARISLNPEVYKFNNKHMLAIGPEGRHNVTDSYTQIQAMFGERATDCEEGDTSCEGEKQNG